MKNTCDTAVQKKEDILFLVHRIPYPPNKGDKIRSFHLLQHLAKSYTVHLACFIDDRNDVQYESLVRQWCGETKFVHLHPLLAKIKSLRALFKNRPLSLDYYQSAVFQHWVVQVQKKYAIKKMVIFSSAMAQFVEGYANAFRLIDFVDMDSDKWLQYAQRKRGLMRWPMNWIYRRESKALFDYEQHIADTFDASFFVASEEAALFISRAPLLEKKVAYFNNGVDTDYFSADHTLSNPYPVDAKVIVFTGAMDYWPNIDAVQWFVVEVFPALKARHPALQFFIVGARPGDEVLNLSKIDGVTVTGTVPDVRPFIAHANASVAPLRIARGIQNKVLEAMAMAKVIVVSPQALEGIDAEPGKELLLATNAADYIRQIDALLNSARPDIEQFARQKVESRYNWESNLCAINRSLESGTVDS
jgi:sugar transferase (PEP-CTERM/EpsH1 system associated)